MKIKLQHWILICIGCALLWLGCNYRLQATSKTETAQILHFIERLSFGVTPGQLQQVKSIGIEAYIQSQLNPQPVKIRAKATTSA